MKKFFGNFLILLSILLVSLAAVPWNNVAQWGVALPILETYEIYIKGGIGALTILIGFIYLLVSNSECRKYGNASFVSTKTAFIPMYLFAVAMMIYGGFINYEIYTQAANTTNLLILGFFGIVVLNMLVYVHFFLDIFRKETNGRRVAHFILLLEFIGISGYLTFWFYSFKITSAQYDGINSFYYIGIVALSIVLLIVHAIVLKAKKSTNDEIEQMEAEIDGIRESAPSPTPKKKRKGDVKHEVYTKPDEKKTMIVSNQQTIVSSEQNLDPTNMIYEDVNVDPEFTKTTPASNQPNSIEYYIEKPKMFKPLDPTFDQLVAYVRELPQVVTKLDDSKITFYVDRKPFLVLMNFGNYYRMAFKYDLEKGIRLIIKYPTISKNKSTRDELWFKANNYDDIPKDVIYSVVKSSYDNINA